MHSTSPQYLGFGRCADTSICSASTRLTPAKSASAVHREADVLNGTPAAHSQLSQSWLAHRGSRPRLPRRLARLTTGACQWARLAHRRQTPTSAPAPVHRGNVPFVCPHTGRDLSDYLGVSTALAAVLHHHLIHEESDPHFSRNYDETIRAHADIVPIRCRDLLESVSSGYEMLGACALGLWRAPHVVPSSLALVGIVERARRHRIHALSGSSRVFCDAGCIFGVVRAALPASSSPPAPPSLRSAVERPSSP
ncbi:hypothetical protein DFH08DRAFT_967683 [Mycena albidolilacea]|uniref:Uncharacterized protein n=1 Tax=Mycena albidolilacea TaxID=1033008 RepID=A0AAD6ZLS4_9AGAR|nr:hypothetical protein DFH08DRAFT_967683 [Mycena albidolilacea]